MKNYVLVVYYIIIITFILTENWFTLGSSVLQFKTGPYNAVQYNTTQYNIIIIIIIIIITFITNCKLIYTR